MYTSFTISQDFQQPLQDSGGDDDEYSNDSDGKRKLRCKGMKRLGSNDWWERYRETHWRWLGASVLAMNIRSRDPKESDIWRVCLYRRQMEDMLGDMRRALFPPIIFR